MFIYLRYIDGSEMNFELSFLNKVRKEVKVWVFMIFMTSSRLQATQ